MLGGPGRTIKRARILRKTMSLPEGLLWRELRKRPAGIKFRRQHPAGPYILDFFCSDARLAIEIDGEAHDRGDRPQRDDIRDAWLTKVGVTMLRIPAADVLADLEAVIRYVVNEARARIPHHHPADRPPPRSGEE
jgi:very-short-patch-repair endonuclease